MNGGGDLLASLFFFFPFLFRFFLWKSFCDLYFLSSAFFLFSIYFAPSPSPLLLAYNRQRALVRFFLFFIVHECMVDFILCAYFPFILISLFCIFCFPSTLFDYYLMNSGDDLLVSFLYGSLLAVFITFLHFLIKICLHFLSFSCRFLLLFASTTLSYLTSLFSNFLYFT